MENVRHAWRIGDLCKAVYNNVGEGLLYRVLLVDTRSTGGGMKYTVLKVTPVYGVMASIERRKTRSLGADWCTYVSLTDLGTEYMRLGNFIRDQAMRFGDHTAQEPTDAVEDVPESDDEQGMCADIAARND